MKPATIVKADRAKATSANLSRNPTAEKFKRYAM
eukprot:CAMPEP_0117762904 /NCGR_PEP_ID=MMETSP0947-20121206/18274_1 /TAXON_ID=44440 /ORGANISM="Chattonella subsalsa, Strain CCMP2191" /LENGTH=33 /DNA_ID= /DNA_START= /DNA_END= /DNA_ORIENTATION=